MEVKIVDLEEKHLKSYLCCLEEWSDEFNDAGDHKEKWYSVMKDNGLRVKVAVINDQIYGMIQYLPIEYSTANGCDSYFINCIWVHGYDKGVGFQQKKGIGKKLLLAAENDVKSLNKKGLVAWGVALPFWMKASWFKKQGYKKVDRDGIALLLWKPFEEKTDSPKWIRVQKKPRRIKGQVTVTAFVNGWCPAQNLNYERAKRVASEYNNLVDFRGINTLDRKTFLEWGISDAVYIDNKRISNGPPLTYEKIKGIIDKKIKKIKT